ncbi:NgoBV family restriction endonuclease [Vibrio harveyi]|uniref:NgoBV family restriction endonuclease n=1 Tax=Vibrio harveyi TaxID=669 RepID=UPI0040675FC7
MFTSQDLIEKLHSEITLHNGAIGSVTVSLLGVDHQVTGRDAIGHLIQEWLFSWCSAHNFQIIPNPNSQAFPDFYIGNIGNEAGQLEIKNFYSSATPAFDVADAYAFIEQLPQNIHKLYADFLVFSYDLNNAGQLSIQNANLYKIWEVMGPSASNHVGCQIRGKKCTQDNRLPLSPDNLDTAGRIQKFRPCNIRSQGNSFTNASTFLDAVYRLIMGNHDTARLFPNWREQVAAAHEAKYGSRI